MSQRLKLLWTASTALILGVILGITLLQRSDPTQPDGKAARAERIILITHGQAADPFWNIVRHGAEDAATQLGISVDYRAPETFDMFRMAELITSAANQRPDGIIVSIPDSSALAGAISGAVKAGIPVVSINSGAEASPELGALTHVGQDEYLTGKRLGERLRHDGAGKVLCVNQEVGNTALDARCKGVEDGFGAAVPVLPTSIDPQEVKSKIGAALTRDQGIDAIVTLSAPLIGEPAIQVARQAPRPVKIATFDMSPGFLEAIRQGEATYAMDQQAYLQGYLSTIILANRIRYGVMPANRLIETGPNFVSKADAARVLALSRRAIR
jgi:simple sugar transport system substrate-binding protein